MSCCARRITLTVGVLGAVCVATVCVNQMRGADHGDTPLLKQVGRHDARLTDLFAFTRGDNLVIALCSDPTIPQEVTEYLFPSDLTLRFHIDNKSPVEFDDIEDLMDFGGTIAKPRKISADIVIEVTFKNDGTPRLKFEGLPKRFKKEISFFVGLRDDPFIRTPRNGRNVAAVILEIPLEAVIDSQPTLLIWGTSKVPDINGPISEHAGLALRSQFIAGMNTLRPRDHFRVLGLVPDVIIFDLLFDAAFPNGRELTDDVVGLVFGGVLPGEDPDRDGKNDFPFLNEFPYLADPQ